MHDRSLDSMASDSYLLKAPPASCPQYPCPSRPAKARRSTSWRVVVSLVLLLVAIMGLAALAYLQRMELLDMRNSLANIRSEFKVVSEKLESRLHSYELFRTFEADPNGGNDFDGGYKDDDDDDERSEPDLDTFYYDTEDTNVVEGKARDPEDGARPPVPRLEPASGHEQPDDATTTTTSSLEPMGTSLLCPPRADPNGGNDFDDGYEDDDDDDERSEPDKDPVYDDPEDTNVVEGKARDPEDGARPPVARLEPASGHEQPVPRLEPASGHEQPDDATTTTTSSLEPMFMDRRRRDVRQAGRPQPQLKLYHMLQTHGLSAAAPPPEQPWGQYGARHPQDRHGYGRPQPMYAEHAPTAFVPPPQRHAAVNAAPVASRRSRVMDGVGTSPGLGRQQQQHHRRRHQHRSRPQQGAFQLQNLQDVTQEVPQGGSARSVEVGRPRWQQQQQWPSPTPRPTSWSPTERAGGWRERVRAARSIDGDVEVEQTWRPYAPAVVEGPAIAAHFVGDTARHRGTHHYDDNGRLKHPAGEYADWTASPWVRELGLDHHFKLAGTGSHITVDTPGLYLVYAQVNYANDKDENGFWLYRNQQKELLCATAGASGQDVRANTCFTAGVLHLFKGDRVSLKDLAGDRYRVLDHPGRSFVGMVNLSACKLKTEQPSRATA